ncbi:MAG: molecular chaperone HtpG, partial [Cyanobacteria bacterium J06597_1]
VSRSYLHNDRKVKRISDHIAKKVGDRLNDLYKEDYDRYLEVWPDISLFVKFGVMNSDKFYQRVKDILVFKTTQENEGEQTAYVTLSNYLERNSQKQDKTVYYSNDEAAQSAYIELHKSQGLEVLLLDGFIDSHFTGFLERENSEVQFKRVDSELDDTLVDEDSAGDIVDPTTNKTRTETLQDLFKSALGKDKLDVKAQALKSAAVPAMILLPEALRRMQEMAAVMQQDAGAFSLPDEHTLVVNTSHPLVKNLQEMSQGQVIGSDDLTGLICNHIYDLAMMAQRSPDADTMQSFLQRSNDVLTKLTEKALA